jgi:hypothetical protein
LTTQNSRGSRHYQSSRAQKRTRSRKSTVVRRGRPRPKRYQSRFPWRNCRILIQSKICLWSQQLAPLWRKLWRMQSICPSGPRKCKLLLILLVESLHLYPKSSSQLLDLPWAAKRVRDTCSQKERMLTNRSWMGRIRRWLLSRDKRILAQKHITCINFQTKSQQAASRSVASNATHLELQTQR